MRGEMVPSLRRGARARSRFVPQTQHVNLRIAGQAELHDVGGGTIVAHGAARSVMCASRHFTMSSMFFMSAREGSAFRGGRQKIEKTSS